MRRIYVRRDVSHPRGTTRSEGANLPRAPACHGGLGEGGGEGEGVGEGGDGESVSEGGGEGVDEGVGEGGILWRVTVGLLTA